MDIEKPLEGKVAVVTGSSRGIGKQLVLELRRAGASVVGNSVSEEPRNLARVQQVMNEANGGVEWVYGDITTQECQGKLLARAREVAEQVKAGDPRIDYLYLNAAGGLEDDKPDDWAMRINMTSKAELVSEFVPSMAPGGAFVDLTSLWAEKFGDVHQLPAYALVAKSKYQAQEFLRGMIPELGTLGVRALFLSGNVIRGTATQMMLQRSARAMMEALKARYIEQSGENDFPTAEDMGAAGVELLLEDVPSGHTKYVGFMNLDPIKTRQKDAYGFDRKGVEGELPMYGNRAPYNRLYVDEFSSPAENPLGVGKESGVGCYRVRKADTKGHFGGRYDELRLFRGVDQIEMVAQVGGLVLRGLDSMSDVIPMFTSIERGEVHFARGIVPGDRLRVEGRVTNMTPMTARVAGKVYFGETEVLASSFSGLTLKLLSGIDQAQRLMAMQRAER